jgi:sigma-B regulation protein RsbU (phosphoserine phosphatase)
VEYDLEQARRIQFRLVPRDLSVPGLEVAVGFQPCRWVGGDYTDAAVLPDGRVFLGIADVCGKGLAAALVSSSLQTLVRSMLDDNLALDRMMVRLNRFMTSYMDDGRFATMTCALLDPNTGDVQYVNAGHPPALVIGPSGAARELVSGRNLPLGVGSEAFQVDTDRLERGEMLAMYTDGLSEARGPDGEMVGPDSVRDEFGAIHAATIRRPLADARARVREWIESRLGGRSQDDDRTFLLARRH